MCYWKLPFSSLIYLLKMVVFHSCISLPEGKPWFIALVVSFFAMAMGSTQLKTCRVSWLLSRFYWNSICAMVDSVTWIIYPYHISGSSIQGKESNLTMWPCFDHISALPRTMRVQSRTRWKESGFFHNERHNTNGATEKDLLGGWCVRAEKDGLLGRKTKLRAGFMLVIWYLHNPFPSFFSTLRSKGFSWEFTLFFVRI
jgi:hypothetical protein